MKAKLFRKKLETKVPVKSCSNSPIEISFFFFKIPPSFYRRVTAILEKEEEEVLSRRTAGVGEGRRIQLSDNNDFI